MGVAHPDWQADIAMGRGASKALRFSLEMGFYTCYSFSVVGAACGFVMEAAHLTTDNIRGE